LKITSQRAEALEKLPAAVAKVLTQKLASGSFHGSLSAAEAQALAQQLGITVQQLMIELLPFAVTYSIAPISNYNVGAVSMGASGSLYFGANMEFSGQALSFSVHAEQAATTNAWLQGETGLQSLAVTAAPCGYCRQFLYELVTASTLQVYLQSGQSALLTTFLPDAFGPSDLGVTAGLMSPQNNGQILSPQNSDPVALAALAAANASYAPYTKTFAGVALQTGDGSIIQGRYAENAAYNPSMSPMESALVNLVLSGLDYDDITAAVLVENDGPASQAAVTANVLTTVSQVPLTVLALVSDDTDPA
jgi:cytidine deaminase